MSSNIIGIEIPDQYVAHNIRKAKSSDFAAIVRLVNSYAHEGKMLALTEDQVAEHAQSFVVAIDSNGKFAGCARLHAFTPNLAEIKSLAVDRSAQSQGLGRGLVQALELQARALGIKRVFALVLSIGPAREMFIKQGYKITNKDELPEKVYNECNNCPLANNCPEIPVIKTLL